jgi:hypothetical protein
MRTTRTALAAAASVAAAGALPAGTAASVRPQPVAAPGRAAPAPGEAVTIRVVVAVAGGRVAVTHTYHAVRAARRRAWFLTAARLGSCRAGACPSPPQPRGPAI